MQNTKKFLILASLMLAACTSDPLQQQTPGDDQNVQTVADGKICNTSDEALPGQLIAKFSEEAIPTLEKAAEQCSATRSAMTRSGIESLDEILADLKVTKLERVFPYAGKNEAETRAAGLHRWYILEFDPEQDIEEAARRLATVAQISKIQYNKERKKCYDGKVYPFKEGVHGATRAMVTSDFNDPQLFWQWHYINNADQAIATEARAGIDINVADAWKLTAGDPRVIVAIIDEGVKYTHPDLAANMWENPEPSAEYNYQDIHGYNFIDNGPITWDKLETQPNGQVTGDSGHGTHVAGTVAAVNNNGIGVGGVAGGSGKGDGVRLMSCQVFSGTKNPEDVVLGRAIKYAADHGASILQCSYGTSADFTSDRQYEANSPMEIEALLYFMSKKNCDAVDGGLVFYSAGNDSKAISNFPGGFSKCISVTSVGPDGLPAYYTCYGLGCNIAAPGGETVGFSGGERAGVLSTIASEITGSDYGYMQGTSMACPHMSGVAALGLSYALAKGKHYTRDEFVSMILTSVNEIDSRFDGIKSTGAKIDLSNYVGKMGTGLTDAYQLLMQIEGTPCLKLSTDKLELVTLTQYFGGSAKELTYRSVEMSEADMQKLGITTAPKMYNGQLMIKCTKPGVARIKISAVAGGNRPGTETIMGGIEVTKEFAIIAREASAPNGGWL